MDNRPIGIFDSGLGGLTAVKALRELLPEEDIVYFADSGRVPYGARPVEQLRRMAVQDMDFVANHGAKAIIAACGTVSSNAPDLLAGYRLPVFGVLRPGVEAMSRVPGSAPLGVIATTASIRSGAFQRSLEERCPGREIISAACPDFVPLIESGHSGAEDEAVCEAVARYMRPLKERGCAAVLLGCTHFGIIGEAISAYMGARVRLISASACAAEKLRDYLAASGLTGGHGREKYYTSGSAGEFSRLAATFLGRELEAAAEETGVMEC